MNIHIAEEIKEMLYENGSVVIPGLGAFKGNYKSAAVDGVQGQIAPPSLDISFDPNNILNDGIFLDFLKKKHHSSMQEAQMALDAFRDYTSNTFEKHEIIVIPQVGRLYRDFNNKVQFLPDTTNFNTDTYGLPIAQFYPVSRTYVEKSAAIQAIANETPPPSLTHAFPETTADIPYPITTHKVERPFIIPPQWRKFIPGLTVATLVIMTFSIYMHNQNKERTETVHRVPKEKVKLNVSPSEKVSGNTQPPVINTMPVVQPNTNKPIAHEKMVEAEKKQEATAAITLPAKTGKNQAVILLGGFGDKNNINRHKKWLTANGYGINERQNGNITLLSAAVSYSDKQELSRMVSRLEGRFGADAVRVSKK